MKIELQNSTFYVELKNIWEAVVTSDEILPQPADLQTSFF